MDTNRIRQLLDKRDKLDEEIRELVNGEAKERRTPRCGTCGQDGHTSRTCTQRQQA